MMRPPKTASKKKPHALFEVSLKALLINKQGEVLILKARADHPRFSAYYDLPGGRIDTDEINNDSFLRLLKREIREEISLAVRYQVSPIPVSVSKYAIRSKKNARDGALYVLFLGRYQGGTITITDEHTGYRWQKLNKTNIHQYFHPVLARLITNYWQKTN